MKSRPPGYQLSQTGVIILKRLPLTQRQPKSPRRNTCAQDTETSEISDARWLLAPGVLGAVHQPAARIDEAGGAGI